MDTEQISEDIIKILGQHRQDLSIHDMPVDADTYKPKHVNGDILVEIGDQSYSEPTGIQQASITSITAVLCIHLHYWKTNRRALTDSVRQIMSNIVIDNSQIWCSLISKPLHSDGVVYVTMEFMLAGVMIHGE